MSKDLESVFLHTKEILREQAAKAVDEAIDKIYTDYLPHVESDTNFNVRQQATNWIERFLADSLRDEDVHIDVFSKHSYRAEAIRQKIYEDNKEEMIAAIGHDIVERVKTLQDRHSAAWEFKY